MNQENNNGIAALLDEILDQALELSASDIHFEPRESSLRIRFRVDGLLQDGPTIAKARQAALISRIKVLVNLDIAESRLPQDGRVNLKLKNKTIDLRVSTIPTIHGEKVVIRLLSRQSGYLSLEGLGMEKEDLALFQRIISKNNGLVLVTGPTGSGKTTTLYATLHYLNLKEVNITTIEDPVEYQLSGISQIQINPKSGLTFARGLRSILRQDPDIIMVGEIRDQETAKIAIQAALTGHLVLATLHTNDAPSAVTRLQEMGIEKYLIEAILLGVVAQRLVRKTTTAGFRGRTGIYEIMVGVKPEGLKKTLLEDGKLKVERKITSWQEVLRVASRLLETPPPLAVPPLKKQPAQAERVFLTDQQSSEKGSGERISG